MLKRKIVIEYSAIPCGSRWFHNQPWSEVFAAADRTELFHEYYRPAIS